MRNAARIMSYNYKSFSLILLLIRVPLNGRREEILLLALQLMLLTVLGQNVNNRTNYYIIINNINEFI